ncbi:MAG: hypothetical protein OEX00_06750 [Gammaproteobacteria bacterium]|nr:hypothetical protein [Gammaproteobacteria bacterium]MDH5691910.1 hypothetical protein [Gammaproteobacteria bacterium]
MNARNHKKNGLSEAHSRYETITSIDGTHPLRKYCASSYVDYRARHRHGGEVFYFNFALAREMGLIPQSHDDAMNPGLENALLRTFSLQIINEYDIENRTRIKAEDIYPGTYMATRYLQLQHKDKRGLYSGDGRSIWNGYFRSKQGTWDISSCGTGTTRLGPAAQGGKVLIKTGTNEHGYGNGRASLDDGLMAAVMSEIYAQSGISTERTLAIISFKDGSSINVRAGKNLIRPAHLFSHLKQNNYDDLKSVLDYYLDRQIENREFVSSNSERVRYNKLLEQVSEDFARTAAFFETEYIFCWMDWDGDNILMDCGIIDYGSIRQFGLFHHEYRYDDVEMYSTNITEQKHKAKYIVQTFSQLVDFVLTKKKKPVSHFRHDKILNHFDQRFDYFRTFFALCRMGFDEEDAAQLLESRSFRNLSTRFRENCRYFESAKSHYGRYEVTDGITWDAVFCLRDLLREYPHFILTHGEEPMDPSLFMDILRSNYATDDDTKLFGYRKRKIIEFQNLYIEIVNRASKILNRGTDRLIGDICTRSKTINRPEKLTGDGLIHTTNSILKQKANLNPSRLNRLLLHFFETHSFNQNSKLKNTKTHPLSSGIDKKLLSQLNNVVDQYKESI